jgi:hypothetical protein
MIEHDLGGAMLRKVSDERKQFWRDLIERQPRSGLSIVRFCADAGVSQNTFYVWKKRLLTRQAAMAERIERGLVVDGRNGPQRNPAVNAELEAWPSYSRCRIDSA